ncbi:MAG: penicillin-binding transpeptidase domain-containing protein [Lachnospiraceae bacterium]|nr:penicillin-binding transpeptidase domain-containing protein [Lachnospiraceae bacterium]
MKKRRIFFWFKVLLTEIILTVVLFYIAGFFLKDTKLKKPNRLLVEYMEYIPLQEYNKMYNMIDVRASGDTSKEYFIKRNSAIYQGIGMQNMKTEIIAYDEEHMSVKYRATFDTDAGEASFINNAVFTRKADGYKLIWHDSLIFPGLCPSDKTKVSVIKAKRGKILDRNGYIIAGNGIVSVAGVVPGKIKNKKKTFNSIAELLGIRKAEIKKKLLAGWVKEDSFVPLKTIPKIKETDLLSGNTDNKILKEKERQERLLEIPGVMISGKEAREYPYGKAVAHLAGYVQNVTAEDLEQHEGEGYSASSVIGRSGAEALFECKLRGTDGCRIYITDADGREKEEIAYKPVQHGQDIKLSVDINLQMALYNQFKEDKSCSVAINPYTGEVLALVSTPSYDNNSFIIGMSGQEWKALNNDKDQPMYNRFRQAWCPGSSFKPVIAAAGLETGTTVWSEDYGNEGLSWQKDSSWGSYYITTLHATDPAVLDNALVNSDNIYFAKAALRTGRKQLEDFLLKLGFNKELPFEIKMAKSQFSNTNKIETEIQLADTGYGQGEVLINPLHLACIYSAFLNKGNVVMPYLLYKKRAEAKYWISGAFGAQVAEKVLNGMFKVVNDPSGTGYAAHMDNILLAGKTGTAEIKLSKEDSHGTELGWFAVFTTENTKKAVMVVSMAEDVKGRGGSGYVVHKDSQVLRQWLRQ